MYVVTNNITNRGVFMDNLHKKSTQTERTKKYKNSKQIKQLNMDLNPEEMQLLENVLKKYNMRKSNFL